MAAEWLRVWITWPVSWGCRTFSDGRDGFWGPTSSSPGLHSRATSRWSWALHTVHVRMITEEIRGKNWNQKGPSLTSGKVSPLWRQDSRGVHSLHRLCSRKFSRLDRTKTRATLSELRAGLLEQKVGERTSKGLLEESSLFNCISLKGDEVCYEIHPYNLSICDEILLTSNIFKIFQC